MTPGMTSCAGLVALDQKEFWPGEFFNLSRERRGQYLRGKLFARRPESRPTPAFMKIEGRLARPLSSDVTGRSKRNYWTVAPWIIVALIIAIILALMVPGLLMEMRHAF